MTATNGQLLKLTHYFEAHAIFRVDGSLDTFRHIAKKNAFWLSQIKHEEGGEDKPGEWIATTRDTELDRMRSRILDLVGSVTSKGGFLKRWKIEATLYDSKEGDELA